MVIEMAIETGEMTGAARIVQEGGEGLGLRQLVVLIVTPHHNNAWTSVDLWGADDICNCKE